jgi:hypothetical protein
VLSEDLPRAVHAWPTVVCVNRGDDDSSTVGRTLEQSYDATVTTALPSVAALLCALSVVFVATDTLALDGTSRVVAVGLAAALVVVLGVLALVLRRRRVPDEAGQPITAALLVAAAAHPVVVMTLTDEPRQTTALLVVAVGAGAALLSLRWLVGTLYLLWGGWTTRSASRSRPRCPWWSPAYADSPAGSSSGPAPPSRRQPSVTSSPVSPTAAGSPWSVPRSSSTRGARVTRRTASSSTSPGCGP